MSWVSTGLSYWGWSTWATRCWIAIGFGHTLRKSSPPSSPKYDSSTNVAPSIPPSRGQRREISWASTGLSCQEWYIWVMWCCITTRVGHALTGIPPPPHPKVHLLRMQRCKNPTRFGQGGRYRNPAMGSVVRNGGCGPCGAASPRGWAMRLQRSPRHRPKDLSSTDCFGWGSVIVLLTARPNRAACAPGASGWGRWVGRTG